MAVSVSPNNSVLAHPRIFCSGLTQRQNNQSYYISNPHVGDRESSEDWRSMLNTYQSKFSSLDSPLTLVVSSRLQSSHTARPPTT
jgi:hypothetical protein